MILERRRRCELFAVLLLLECGSALAATRYVNINSSTSSPPYSDWSNAAIKIQDAIDVANAGDIILVTNGTYQSGGRVVYGTLTNRVAITKAVSVQSVNGPSVTFIHGYRVPGTTNGDAAVRCAYLTNGATLIGFTLTNGATGGLGNSQSSGGGVSSEFGGIVSNCVISGNSAYGNGGGVSGGTLLSCTISGNTAQYSGAGAIGATLRNCAVKNNNAGGVSSCTLYNCDIRGNSTFLGSGGGAADSTLYDSTIIANYASTDGGGIYYSTATNCTLSGNSSGGTGGGAYQSTLLNCVIASNQSTKGGGGANSFYTNCALHGNSANVQGGGAYYGYVVNCTLTDNSAGDGGGTFGPIVINSIVYYNHTYSGSISSNYSSSTFNFSCTSPAPAGDGNFTNAPLLVSPPWIDMSLQSNSPCINAGRPGAAGLDLAGKPRVVGGAVDLGCFEFQSPSSRISYSWLQQYGLPTDGSADSADPDGDGMNNWAEWRCRTNPTNAASALRIISAGAGQPGVTISWQSSSGVNYFIQRATNLTFQNPFLPLATNLPGQAGTTAFRDSSATGFSPYFYRIGVP